MRVSEANVINFRDFDDVKKGVFQLFTSSVINSKQLSKRSWVEVCHTHSIYGYWDMSHQKCVILTTKALSLSMYVCIYLSIYHGTLSENGGHGSTSRKLSSRYHSYLKFCRLLILTWTNCCTKFQVSNEILTCIFRCLNIVILGFFK
jgi:hypothetical protein